MRRGGHAVSVGPLPSQGRGRPPSPGHLRQPRAGSHAMSRRRPCSSRLPGRLCPTRQKSPAQGLVEPAPLLVSQEGPWPGRFPQVSPTAAKACARGTLGLEPGVPVFDNPLEGRTDLPESLTLASLDFLVFHVERINTLTLNVRARIEKNEARVLASSRRVNIFSPLSLPPSTPF